MNLLDIFLIIPLIWMAWRGFMKGLIIELATLLALILGIYAAINFSWFAGDLLMEYIEIEEKYISVISFIITFLVVVIIVVGIGKLIERVIDLVALGFINRLLGAVFGIVKAIILLSVIILVIETFDKNEKVITPERRKGSALYGPVSSVIPYILDLVDTDKFRPGKKEAEDVFAVL